MAGRHGASRQRYSDFLALWILFVVCTLILRVATDQVSRVESAVSDGRRPDCTWVFFAFWIGWVMVCSR